MSPFLKLIMSILILRALRIFYKAFVSKLYHLKFYEDGIYRVENNQFIPLESIKKGNNLFWCAASYKTAD